MSHHYPASEATRSVQDLCKFADDVIDSENRQRQEKLRAIQAFLPTLSAEDGRRALGVINGHAPGSWKPATCRQRVFVLVEKKDELRQQMSQTTGKIESLREELERLRQVYNEQRSMRVDAETTAQMLKSEISKIYKLVEAEEELEDDQAHDITIHPMAARDKYLTSSVESSSTGETPYAVGTSSSTSATSTTSTSSTPSVYGTPMSSAAASLECGLTAGCSKSSVLSHPSHLQPAGSYSQPAGFNPPSHFAFDAATSTSASAPSSLEQKKQEAEQPQHSTRRPKRRLSVRASNVKKLAERWEKTDLISVGTPKRSVDSSAAPIERSHEQEGPATPAPKKSSTHRRTSSFAPSPLRSVESPSKLSHQLSSIQPSAPPAPSSGPASPSSYGTNLAKSTATSTAASAHASPGTSAQPRHVHQYTSDQPSPGADTYHPTRSAPPPPSPSQRQFPHFFRPHTAFLRQACHECGSVIRYLQQYKRCSNCQFVCHNECEEQVAPKCGFHEQARSTRKEIDLMAATGPGFDEPMLVVACIQAIQDRWLHTPGLYRNPGPEYEHKGLELISRFFKGKGQPNLRCVTDAHEITMCIRLFLQDLKEPLLTARRHDNFVHAAVNNTGQSRLAAVNAVVQTLPRVNFYTLKHIIEHLNCVLAHSAYNQSTQDLIVAEMTPCLMRIRKTNTDEALKPEEEVVDTLLSLSQHHWTKAEKEVLLLDARATVHTRRSSTGKGFFGGLFGR
eukprot:m.251432 g.251432  ORF g.251432 m.251432 type:complete len:734 (+) comp15450_c0_seq1:118-2319(+)